MVLSPPEAGRLEADWQALRGDFPIFENHHPPLHYLDTAASSQKPRCVIDAISRCYSEAYGPVHRGLYPLAENASNHYEAARQTIADFVNAGSASQIVFTRSATEAINLVAYGWAGNHIKSGDEIWVSEMEHHANFLPWHRICQQKKARLRIIPVDDKGQLNLAEEIFGEKTRLIAITLVSNVLGTVNPVKEITSRARQLSVPVLIDAAQAVGHMSVDVQSLDCDFLVSSAHKMCGPTGTGFLYAKTERLAETEPLLLGGGMVDEVNIDHSSWADIPSRFEAGSPNLAGAIGFAAAIDYLRNIGMQAIEQRVRSLTKLASRKLFGIDGLTIYGSPSGTSHSSIISFNVDNIHSHDIAQIAAEHGVAIRAGHHCCQPLMRRLGVSSTARVSFSFYNNEEDIEALIEAIQYARKVFGKP